MPKALVIPADPAMPVRIEDVPVDDLAARQAHVGGDIERVPVVLRLAGREVDAAIYCNAEGKALDLRKNARATATVQRNLFPGDYIAGDAFLVGLDANGDDVDYPAPPCFAPTSVQ